MVVVLVRILEHCMASNMLCKSGKGFRKVLYHSTKAYCYMKYLQQHRKICTSWALFLWNHMHTPCSWPGGWVVYENLKQLIIYDFVKLWRAYMIKVQHWGRELLNFPHTARNISVIYEMLYGFSHFKLSMNNS